MQAYKKLDLQNIPRKYTHGQYPTTIYPRTISHDNIPTDNIPRQYTHGQDPTTIYPRTISHDNIPTDNIPRQYTHRQYPTTIYPQTISHDNFTPRSRQYPTSISPPDWCHKRTKPYFLFFQITMTDYFWPNGRIPLNTPLSGILSWHLYDMALSRALDGQF